MEYFAYGFNLDQDKIKERCPDSKLIGKAVLKEYKIAFTFLSRKTGYGCADILFSPGDEVWGLLYEISQNDLRGLDKAEGYPLEYIRLRVEVIDEQGQKRMAEVYKVRIVEGAFIEPSREYLAIMQKASLDFNFPEHYRSTLSGVTAAKEPIEAVVSVEV